MDDAILRKVQLVQLEIAKEIKRVCQKNNINYFLVGGTLLGAVRHKGFIPWDDDLDIGFLREEYDRFLRIAEEELDDKYALVEWIKVAEYPHPMAKIVKKGTLYVEEKRKDNANQGIWVDIFPYDAVPVDKKEQHKQGKKIMLYRGLVRAKCKYQTWHSQGRFLWKKWVKNLPLRFGAVFFSKGSLVRRYETAARLHNGEPAELYFENGPDKYGDWSIPVKCFEELIELPFEDTFFWAPKGFDLYLKTAYGDYMKLPPENERGGDGTSQHSIVQISFGDGENKDDNEEKVENKA